jgi:hypothetical protein
MKSTPSKWEKGLSKQNPIKNPKETEKKAYSLEEVRKKHKTAYAPWTDGLDAELTELFCLGKTYKEMAKHFARTEGAITSRIAKLDLEKKYG